MGSEKLGRPGAVEQIVPVISPALQTVRPPFTVKLLHDDVATIEGSKTKKKLQNPFKDIIDGELSPFLFRAGRSFASAEFPSQASRRASVPATSTQSQNMREKLQNARHFCFLNFPSMLTLSFQSADC